MAKSLLLKDVPEDVWKIIFQKQTEEKNSRVSAQFSMASAVYKIIRNVENKKNK